MSEDIKDLSKGTSCCSIGCIVTVILLIIAVDLIVLGVKSAIWIWNL